MDLNNRIEKLIKELREIEKQTGCRFYMKYDPTKDFDITLKVEKMLKNQFLVCSDSREIADNLEIEHSKLIRKYDKHKEYFNLYNDAINGLVKINAESYPTFTVIEGTYTDKKGEERRCLKLDQSATELLISMFTNKTATRCKQAYIIQFHLMANFIKDTNQTEEFRNYVKSQYRTHTDVLKEELNLGKGDTKEYIKYANIINKKVLGTSKSTFCKQHGIDSKDFRNSLNDTMNKQLLELEKRVDAWVMAYSDEGLTNQEIYDKVKERIENYKFKN